MKVTRNRWKLNKTSKTTHPQNNKRETNPGKKETERNNKEHTTRTQLITLLYPRKKWMARQNQDHTAW